MTNERQRRISQQLAAQRRRAVRWQKLRWLAAAMILVALASAVTVVVFHRGDEAVASGTGQLSPEGIPLQTGVPLTSIAGAAGGQPVDGIQCEASEQVDSHIHAHLEVFVNGAPRSIPYGIGIVTPAVTQTSQGPLVQATCCYYLLHTHANDGVIHVESSTQRLYALGDFFDIWRQPLSSGRVGAATGSVTAYLNGLRCTGDPRGIVLREHEGIQLDVGTPIVRPQPVDWSKSEL